MDRTGCVSVCIATDRQNKSIIVITNQQSIKQAYCSASHLFAVLSVKGVRVNTHFSVVPRLRTSVAVTALVCTGRPLPYISCQNSTSGDDRGL